MNKEMKKVPTVRFKGFADDWEQRKLGDIVDFLDTQRKPLTENIREKGPYPYYGASGIVDYVAGYIFDEELVLLSEDGANITDRNYPVCFLASGKYWVNNHAHVLKTKEGIDNNFICNSLECKDFSIYNTGMAMPKLNQDICKRIPVDFPTYDEQEKIGNYFRDIDYFITLHQRKLDQLQTLKKYFLQNMFPTKGEKVPAIRFKGFTGDWEQRKLDDVVASFEYGLNAAAKDYDGKNKYLRITDIDDSTHEFLKENLTSPDTDISETGNYKLQEGDVLFARTGASVGKTYIYKESDGLVFYAGFLIRAKIKKDYNPEFIFQNTLTPNYDKYIRITSQRSGQPGVNAREYGEYTLMVPSLLEQRKIGKCLRNLDNLITLHQRKCDQLQSLKKFMLQNLFI